jgi:hypothetical protein
MASLRFSSLARTLLAVVALAPAVLAGCGSTTTSGSDGACSYGGETYDVGESFPAEDGCNTCTCMEDGSAACTLMGCVNTCVYGNQVYNAGDSFPLGDGCNTCTCMDDGNVACTGVACLTCVHEGATYNPGDTFPAGDGCNTCECMGDGTVACTEIACAACIYAGAEYQPGEMFPALDGCNTCTCLEDSSISCTEIACACSPPDEWWRLYTSLDAQQCLLIDFDCPDNTTRFDNSCGCGCEQSAACPQYFDCMPPAQCNIDEIMAECPYSEILM